MGRLVRDPDIRYAQGNEPYCIARFTLAVDRGVRRDSNNEEQQTADFPRCVAFRKAADFIEKYCQKGTKIIVEGNLRTGSYMNRDGNKVYTTEVNVNHAEFAESRAAAQSYQESQAESTEPTPENVKRTRPDPDNFMNIPDSISEELPFN